MHNLYIPSKGRAGSSNLLKMLSNIGSTANLIVEPIEYEDYRSAYGDLFKIIILPDSGQGITYVRNFIKQYSESAGDEHYWQLDDDISYIYSRSGTKLERCGLEALNISASAFKDNGVWIGALEYRQFAWSATKQFIINSFCDVAVYVDNMLTAGMRYDANVEGKEDRDFAMQAILAGGKTARITEYAFSAPPNGSNQGGLKEIFYDAGKEVICAQAMVNKWGNNICNIITKPNGRQDVKINWDRINTRQASLF